MTTPSGLAGAHIVHVMGWVNRQYGSFERFLCLLARELSAEGARLHVVFQAEPEVHAFLADLDADVHAVPAARSWRDHDYYRRIRSLLTALDADLVHGHHGRDSYMAVLAGRRRGVPCFYTKHNNPGDSNPPVKWAHHRWLGRQVVRLYGVSQAVSDRSVELGVPAAKVRTVYLGTDTSVYRPDPQRRERTRAALGLSPATRLVLSTSHFRHGKGVVMLPALAAALADDPGDTLVAVAGTGPAEGDLRAQVISRGLGPDRFRLLGPRNDIPDLLAAADLFLFTTAGRTEGFGLSLVEALATGVPVVAADAVRDFRGLLEGAVLLFPKGDIDELVRLSRSVLTDRSRATELAGRGLALATSMLDSRTAVQTYIADYRAALAVGGHPGRRPDHIDPREPGTTAMR